MKKTIASLFFYALASSSIAQNDLKIISPRNLPAETTAEYVNVVGSFDKDASVTVQGVPALVLPTAVFVRDLVPVAMGENKIAVEAIAPGGKKASTTIVVTRKAPETTGPVTDRIVIDTKSIKPSADFATIPGEPIQVSFSGTAGASAEVEFAGKAHQLSEVLEDKKPTGQYQATIIASQPEPASPLTFRLKAQDGQKIQGEKNNEHKTKHTIEVWNPTELRLGMVKDDFGQVTHGLHDVRLGGPYLAELSSGTIVRLIGKESGSYRIKLAQNTEGYISQEDISTSDVPSGTSVPHIAPLSVSITTAEDADLITVPMPERIPFAIYPATANSSNARLEVDLYGAHHASTWITHRADRAVVKEVTLEQVAPDHLRLHADLYNKQLWGWKYELTTNSLIIRVRKPPAIASGQDSPVKGLVIAVEAGHGGSRDRGASGVSGSFEKDITRLTTDALIDLLTSAGATAVNVRKGDEPTPLSRKVQRAIDANAHLYIAIHCNSAGNDRGYLRVSGVSTYYKYSNGFELSDFIHKRLMQNLGIPDFGNVGNFNYSPLRNATWMPSMLIEQAFISNPADEAKLLDPAFRQKIAQSALEGIEDFLRSRKEPGLVK